MPRTILVHLNVSPEHEDTRSADAIADELLAALEFGLGLPTASLASGKNDAYVVCTLAEEV